MKRTDYKKGSTGSQGQVCDSDHLVCTNDPLYDQSGMRLIGHKAFVAYLQGKERAPKVMLGLRGLSLQLVYPAALSANDITDVPCLLLWPEVCKAFNKLASASGYRLAYYLGFMMRLDMLQAFFQQATLEAQQAYVDVVLSFAVERQIAPMVLNHVSSVSKLRTSRQTLFLEQEQLLSRLGYVLARFARAAPFCDLINACDSEKTLLRSQDWILEIMNAVLEGMIQEREDKSCKGYVNGRKADRLAKEKAVAQWCLRYYGSGKVDELRPVLSLLYQHKAYHTFLLFYDALSQAAYAWLQPTKVIGMHGITVADLQCITTAALDVGVYYRAHLPSVFFVLNNEYRRLINLSQHTSTMQICDDVSHQSKLLLLLEQWESYLRCVLRHSWHRQTGHYALMLKQWVQLELLKFLLMDTSLASALFSSMLDIFPEDLGCVVTLKKTCDVVTSFLKVSCALYVRVTNHDLMIMKLQNVWSLLHVRMMRFGYDLALVGVAPVPKVLERVADAVCELMLSKNIALNVSWRLAYRSQIEHYFSELPSEKKSSMFTDSFRAWHQFSQTQCGKLERVSSPKTAPAQQLPLHNQADNLDRHGCSSMANLHDFSDFSMSCSVPEHEKLFGALSSPVLGSYIFESAQNDSIIVPHSPAGFAADTHDPNDTIVGAVDGFSHGSSFWDANRTKSTVTSASWSMFRSVSSEEDSRSDYGP